MKYLLSFAVSLMILAAPSAYAKSINMHVEPKSDSKISGSINTDNGVTIVYAPKDGKWIKIANPLNGDVGWVKSADLGNNGYHLQVATRKDGSGQYNIYQFSSGGQQFSQQQIDNELKWFERQQQIMHQHMQQSMADMINMFYYPRPVFVPVVIMPVDQKPQAAKPAKTSKKVASA